MKTKNDFAKQVTWAVVYSIGFYAGHKWGTPGYLIGSIIFYFLFGYFIAFIFWVLRGYQVGKVDVKKIDKFNWHKK